MPGDPGPPRGFTSAERKAALLAVLGATGFLALAAFVAAGGQFALDRTLLLAFREAGNPAEPIGPAWLQGAARDVTALGSVTVLTLLTLAAAGHLYLTRGRGPAMLLILSVAGGTLLSFLLKLGFTRPRPDLAEHLTVVFTASFPSSHAMMSATAYATLGAVLAEEHPRPSVARYVISVAATVMLLVGISRVYLGVHWPSDVLAGWCAGLSWAALCWLAVRVLRRRAGRPPRGAA